MVVLHVHALEEQFLITSPSLDGITIKEIMLMIEESYVSLFANRPPLIVQSVKDASGYLLPAILNASDVLSHQAHIHVIPKDSEYNKTLLPPIEDLERFLRHFKQFQTMLIHMIAQYSKEDAGLNAQLDLHPELPHLVLTFVNTLCQSLCSTNQESSLMSLFEETNFISNVFTNQKLVSHHHQTAAFHSLVCVYVATNTSEFIERSVLDCIHSFLTTQKVQIDSKDATNLTNVLVKRLSENQDATYRNQIHNVLSLLENNDQIVLLVKDSKITSTNSNTKDSMNEILYLLQSKTESCRTYALSRITAVASEKESWDEFTLQGNAVPELMFLCMEWNDDEEGATELLLSVVSKACSYASTCVLSSIKVLTYVVERVISENEDVDEKFVTILEHMIYENSDNIAQCYETLPIELWIKLIVSPTVRLQRIGGFGLASWVKGGSSSQSVKPVIKYASVLLDALYSNDVQLVRTLIDIYSFLNTKEVYKARLIELGSIPLLVMLLSTKELQNDETVDHKDDEKDNSPEEMMNEDLLYVQRVAAKVLASIASSSTGRKQVVLEALTEEFGETGLEQFTDNVVTLYLEMIVG